MQTLSTASPLDLADADQTEEAVDVGEECVKTRPEIAEQDPEFRNYLATSLSNLTVDLMSQSRFREAVDAGEESVKLLRELAKQDPEMRKDLADTLHNLALALKHLGWFRRYEAATVEKESADLHRQIAQ